MTFHVLITGLLVLASLLGLAALTSWRQSRRLSERDELELDFRYWRDEWEWEQ